MKTLLPWVLLASLALMPACVNEYYVNLTSQILIAVVLASSLNLLVGYGGLTSLGHAAYLGVSAYGVVLLTVRLGLSHVAAITFALLLTALVGAVFGWIALRASGLRFLMLTLALSQVLWGLGYRLTSVTNGDNGLSGLTRPKVLGVDFEESNAFFWLALAMTMLVLVVVTRVVHSPFGAALRGTKDQPRRMGSLGYDVWAIRWSSFVLASVLAGVAGLMYAYFHKYVHPSVMSITASAEILLSVIAGGAGSIAGPVVGAALVMLLKNYVSGYVERWNALLGIVFVFIVLVMPEGIVPGVRRRWLAWRTARRPAAVEAKPLRQLRKEKQA